MVVRPRGDTVIHSSVSMQCSGGAVLLGCNFAPALQPLSRFGPPLAWITLPQPPPCAGLLSPVVVHHLSAAHHHLSGTHLSGAPEPPAHQPRARLLPSASLPCVAPLAPPQRPAAAHKYRQQHVPISLHPSPSYSRAQEGWSGVVGFVTARHPGHTPARALSLCFLGSHLIEHGARVDLSVNQPEVRSLPVPAFLAMQKC